MAVKGGDACRFKFGNRRLHKSNEQIDNLCRNQTRGRQLQNHSNRHKIEPKPPALLDKTRHGNCGHESKPTNGVGLNG